MIFKEFYFEQPEPHNVFFNISELIHSFMSANILSLIQCVVSPYIMCKKV